MTKHVLIGDLHFGVKNGCKIMLQHQKDFFNDLIIPFCEANHICSIWQTGDFFDVRKTTNSEVLTAVNQIMGDIYYHDIDFNGVLGNHDIVHKNTSFINSPELFLTDWYQPVVNFQTFTEIGVDFVGWINAGNQEEILSKVSSSKSKYCFGHFEFSGFEMQKGYIMEHGLDPNLFSKYDLVISGHYHSSSSKGNVIYVGTPIQFTWADYGEEKGFWVFDDVDGHITFIKNDVELFHKIEYDEENIPDDTSYLANKWVRLIVKNKTDQKRFDAFVSKLNNSNLAELKIIEDLVKHNVNYKVETVDITNASMIMKSYVEQTEFPNLNSTDIYNRLNEIYKEALLKT